VSQQKRVVVVKWCTSHDLQEGQQRAPPSADAFAHMSAYGRELQYDFDPNYAPGCSQCAFWQLANRMRPAEASIPTAAVNREGPHLAGPTMGAFTAVAPIVSLALPLSRHHHRHRRHGRHRRHRRRPLRSLRCNRLRRQSHRLHHPAHLRCRHHRRCRPCTGKFPTLTISQKRQRSLSCECSGTRTACPTRSAFLQMEAGDPPLCKTARAVARCVPAKKIVGARVPTPSMTTTTQVGAQMVMVPRQETFGSRSS
jgi:hypothetical protein